MKYSLYKVDFFEVIISKMCDLKVCSACVTPQVSVFDILEQILKDNNHLSISDIFQLNDVDNFIKRCIKEAESCEVTGTATVQFLENNKIISAFSVDCDESDSYIVVVEE